MTGSQEERLASRIAHYKHLEENGGLHDNPGTEISLDPDTYAVLHQRAQAWECSDVVFLQAWLDTVDLDLLQAEKSRQLWDNV